MGKFSIEIVKQKPETFHCDQSVQKKKIEVNRIILVVSASVLTILLRKKNFHEFEDRSMVRKRRKTEENKD